MPRGVREEPGAQGRRQAHGSPAEARAMYTRLPGGLPEAVRAVARGRRGEPAVDRGPRGRRARAGSRRRHGHARWRARRGAPRGQEHRPRSGTAHAAPRSRRESRGRQGHRRGSGREEPHRARHDPERGRRGEARGELGPRRGDRRGRRRPRRAGRLRVLRAEGERLLRRARLGLQQDRELHAGGKGPRRARVARRGRLSRRRHRRPRRRHVPGSRTTRASRSVPRAAGPAQRSASLSSESSEWFSKPTEAASKPLSAAQPPEDDEFRTAPALHRGRHGRPADHMPSSDSPRSLFSAACSSLADGASSDDVQRPSDGDPAPAIADDDASPGRLTWKEKVQPLLADQCKACHLGERFAFASLRRTGATFTAQRDRGELPEVPRHDLARRAPRRAGSSPRCSSATIPRGCRTPAAPVAKRGDPVYTVVREWIDEEKAHDARGAGITRPCSTSPTSSRPSLAGALGRSDSLGPRPARPGAHLTRTSRPRRRSSPGRARSIFCRVVLRRRRPVRLQEPRRQPRRRPARLRVPPLADAGGLGPTCGGTSASRRSGRTAGGEPSLLMPADRAITRAARSRGATHSVFVRRTAAAQGAVRSSLQVRRRRDT